MNRPFKDIPAHALYANIEREDHLHYMHARGGITNIEFEIEIRQLYKHQDDDERDYDDEFELGHLKSWRK